MTRPLTPSEQRLLAAVRARLDALGVPPADSERTLALAEAELVTHPPAEDDEADRVDPRVVARAAAAVARPALRGRDVAPVRLGGASPSELARELRARLRRSRPSRRAAGSERSTRG